MSEWRQNDEPFAASSLGSSRPTTVERRTFGLAGFSLRALGLVFLSAFYSLADQIQGLIGPTGILPADLYLARVAVALPGFSRFWYAPTLLWLGASHGALTTLVIVGAASSVALVLNLWPRGALVIAFLAFLSFIAAAQDFASYQSDGMLLEAGFSSLFYAPRGFLPKLGTSRPPLRAARLLLLWEWFRIYFESGVVKLASGDVSWRDLTAMDHYYENGPLPTWVGWYVQHWPHGFHALTSALTLVIELLLVWFVFFPRRYRLLCFLVVTPLQLGIILTANYAFLNYLVLSLGIILLDDEQVGSFSRWFARRWQRPSADAGCRDASPSRSSVLVQLLLALPLGWIFYATCVDFILTGAPKPLSWLLWPAHALEPFRVANRYGLFATMTPARYEIEFQGSIDGREWKPYPFRYKPQALDVPPGIYAPYQPRFEWNLWFASLSSCRDNRWVLRTEARLLVNDESVLALFASNPFPDAPPREVRSLSSQYWFTDRATKKETGTWWKRDPIGPYCPALERTEDGSIKVVARE